MGFYDAKFVPAKGMDRAHWKAQRTQRLSHAGHIQITALAARVRIQGDQATVDFDQSYKATNYQDKVHKTLELRRSGDQWRIVSESASAH